MRVDLAQNGFRIFMYTFDASDMTHGNKLASSLNLLICASVFYLCTHRGLDILGLIINNLLNYKGDATNNIVEESYWV